MITRILVLSLLALLLLGGLALAQGTAPGVTIGFEPGQPVEMIQVTLPHGEQKADISLFLNYQGDGDLENALLFASLRDAGGAPLTSGSLQFLDPVQGNTPLNRVDFSAGMGAMPVLLHIENFGAVGSFQGFIGLETETGVYRIADLQVARPGQPVVSFLEAGDNAAITLETFGPTLTDRLFLQETGGVTDETPLTVSASQLRSANGDTVEVTITPDALTLTPYLTQPITITAGPLPAIGDYAGVLTLAYGSTQVNYALTVRRQAEPGKLAFEAISPPVAYRCLTSLCATTVTLNLRETEGRPIDLHPPILTKLVTEGEGNSQFEADYTSWRVLDQSGQVISAGPSAASAGGMSDLTSPDVYQLDPAQQTQMQLVIEGVTRPGRYEGAVQVTTPGNSVYTDTFTLFVKDYWLLAAVVIALGAFLSFWLRTWLGTGRKQAIEEIAIRRALNRVREAIPDPEDEIRKQVMARLETLLIDNRYTPETDVSAALKTVDKILNNYLVVQDALQLDLATLITDEDKRKDFEVRMAEIREALALKGIVALEQDELVGQAQSLRHDVLKQAADRLQSAVDELSKSLEKRRDNFTASTLSDEEKQAFSERLAKVEGELGSAQKLLKQSRTSTDEMATMRLLAEASRTYESVREEYEKILLDYQSRTSKGILPMREAARGPEAPRIAPPSARVTIPTLASIQWRIRFSDWMAFAIVTLLSVLIGLQILWAPKNDFGGLVDYITVFLWGFGLHALNSIAQPAALNRLGLAWRPGNSEQ